MLWKLNRNMGMNTLLVSIFLIVLQLPTLRNDVPNKTESCVSIIAHSLIETSIEKSLSLGGTKISKINRSKRRIKMSTKMV